MIKYRDNIECPHCGELDENHPSELVSDGDDCELACETCGKSMRVTLSVRLHYRAEKGGPES